MSSMEAAFTAPEKSRVGTMASESTIMWKLESLQLLYSECLRSYAALQGFEQSVMSQWQINSPLGLKVSCCGQLEVVMIE